jgi:hypothetical protein
MDILSERGYSVSVDSRRWVIPVRVNPKTWEIDLERNLVYLFEVRSPQHQIRGVFEESNPGRLLNGTNPVTV